MPQPEALLKNMFTAALDGARAAVCVPPHLPPRPKGRTLVIGAGKAAAAMAKAVEDHWDGPIGGLVVTRYRHGLPCRYIRVIEAAHPVPDAASVAAGAEILEMVQNLGPNDLVICLLSGGGSALLAAPITGITLDAKREVTRQLLVSGASIHEINCVRKHLSAIKGGRLAVAAWPAQMVTLAMSDVPGDDAAVIASGPTVPDPTTIDDARAVLLKYRIALPEPVVRHLAAAEETPKPDDPRFAASDFRLIARPFECLARAAEVAQLAGYTPLILGDAIEGEAREVGRVHAGIVRSILAHAQPLSRPCAIISGGETSVTVTGKGRGGPNSEFLLGFGTQLGASDAVWAMACDTDGVDGFEEVAGAVWRPDTLARAAAAGMHPSTYLANNDALSFFESLKQTVVTGPTLTNVNDFRAVLITA